MQLPAAVTKSTAVFGFGEAPEADCWISCAFVLDPDGRHIAAVCHDVY